MFVPFISHASFILLFLSVGSAATESTVPNMVVSELQNCQRSLEGRTFSVYSEDTRIFIQETEELQSYLDVETGQPVKSKFGRQYHFDLRDLRFMRGEASQLTIVCKAQPCINETAYISQKEPYSVLETETTTHKSASLLCESPNIGLFALLLSKI
jgi:hypothetical protein